MALDLGADRNTIQCRAPSAPWRCGKRTGRSRTAPPRSARRRRGHAFPEGANPAGARTTSPFCRATHNAGRFPDRRRRVYLGMDPGPDCASRHGLERSPAGQSSSSVGRKAKRIPPMARFGGRRSAFPPYCCYFVSRSCSSKNSKIWSKSKSVFFFTLRAKARAPSRTAVVPNFTSLSIRSRQPFLRFIQELCV